MLVVVSTLPVSTLRYIKNLCLLCPIFEIKDKPRNSFSEIRSVMFIIGLSFGVSNDF